MDTARLSVLLFALLAALLGLIGGQGTDATLLDAARGRGPAGPRLGGSPTPALSPSPSPTPTTSPIPNPYCGLAWRAVGNLHAVDEAGGDVWALSPAQVLHWDGRDLLPVPGPYSTPIWSLAVAAPDDAWMVASEPGPWHRQGQNWSSPPFPVPTPRVSFYLSDIDAGSPTSVWASASYEPYFDLVRGLVYWWDGVAWRTIYQTSPISDAPPAGGCEIGSRLHSVDALGPADAWLIGTSSNICPPAPQRFYLRCGTASCVGVSVPIYAEAFAGVAPQDVWAVGAVSSGSSQSAIAHWDGAAWTPASIPNIGPLTQVSARASNDVWAGNQNGFLRWDGTTWHLLPAPQPYSSLVDLEVVGPADVWITVQVSGTDMAFHYSDPGAFVDVPSGNPFYPFVRWMACGGYISGYGCGGPGEPCPGPYFRPGANVTRGQLLKMVVNAAGWPVVTPAVPTFADVPVGHPFYSFIETGVSHGIISGYGCGGAGEPCDPQNRPYFRPGNDITRGQLSKVITLARSYPILNPPTPTFADVPPTQPFYGFVEAVYAQGIVSGYTCGGPGEPCDPQQRPYFRPYNNATRGQVTKFVTLAYGGP